MINNIHKYSEKEWDRYVLVILFSISFILHIIPTLFIPMIRFNPDEISSIGLAALLAGKDFSGVLGNIGAYYGNIAGLLFTPILVLINNPFTMYKLMLLIVCIIASINSIIIYKIIIMINKEVTILRGIILSIICNFIVGWRATTVMNENILQLCIWLTIYFLVKLQTSIKTKDKQIYTGYLLGISALGYISHTRYIIVIIAVLVTIIFYHYMTKISLVDYKVIAFGTTILYMVTNFIIDLVSKYIFNIQQDEVLHNSVESISGILSVNTADIGRMSVKGVLAFIDMYLGNTFAIIIISSGIFLLMLWWTCSILLQSIFNRIMFQDIKTKEDKGFFILFFSFIGIQGMLVSYSIINMAYALAAHEIDLVISYYLYPRYFGFFLGPLALVFLLNLMDKKINVKAMLISSFVILISITSYIFPRFIKNLADQGTDILDAWRVMYPFAFQTKWREPIWFNDYIVVSIVILIIVIVCYYLSKNKFDVLLIFICCIAVYQYHFTALVFDRGISEYTFSIVNDTYNLINDNEEIFNDIDTIYVSENAHRRSSTALQFLLHNKKIVYGIKDDVEQLIFTTENPNNVEQFSNGEYSMIEFINDDEIKEYLVFNSDSLIEKFTRLQLDVKHISSKN